MRTALVVLLLLGSTAHAERRCVGPAVVGTIAGSMLAGLAVGGGAELVGYDIQHERRAPMLFVGGMITGAVVGPVASCAAVSDEPHAVPAASFVIGGAILGGGLGFALTAERAFQFRPGGNSSDPGGAAVLMAFATVGGIVGGGFGGYYLHRKIFGLSDEAIAPVATRGMTGVVVAARF